MAKGRKFKRGGNKVNPEAAAEAKQEKTSPEAKTEPTATEKPTEEPKADETAGPTKEVEKGGTSENENAKEKSGKKRKRPMKGKKKFGKKPTADGKQASAPKKDLAGLIFMCNEVTRNDCFKYHVFGFPEQKKNLIEQVTKGMRLFLYDIDKKLLFGIYKASSAGGMNLVPEAYQDSDRKFPAQVRFRIHKECMPLEVNEFKQAIKDNYFNRGKFNVELNAEQVDRLVKLYRPLDERGQPKPKPKPSNVGKREPVTKSNVSRGPPRVRAPPPRVAAPARPRALQYARDYAPTYVREELRGGYVAAPLIPNPELELLEAEAIRRRQLQEAATLEPYMDPAFRHADALHKRYAESVYADSLPRRPLLQESLYGLDYQREAPYRDSLHAYPGGLGYDSIAASQLLRYP